MWYFLNTFDSPDVVERVDGWGETPMKAEDLRQSWLEVRDLVVQMARNVLGCRSKLSRGGNRIRL